ncbi:immunoglobulin domain-containing protein [Labilibaculum sp.]|uniref:immunoglobulin domain-containing protein n=1 Tax=Labilibaculum sp. TaxID=2060723 RepID=UPI0035649925
MTLTTYWFGSNLNFKDMKNGEIFTQLKRLFTLSFFILLFTIPFAGMAQYDYEHYVPPFYNGSSASGDIGYHRAILSTNSVSDVTVQIFKGYDTSFKTVTISAGSPAKIEFPTTDGQDMGTISSVYDYDFPLNVVGPKELNVVLPNEGLRFYSSDAPFFVNIRHSTSAQGTSLTTKGTYAYGTDFYSGHVYTDGVYKEERRSHFISVMATEDNTTVSFSGIKVPVLSSYNGSSLEAMSVTSTDVISATLKQGESYIIAVDHDLSGFTTSNMNDLNGTHITSDKDIVVNSGSWTSGGDGNMQDIGTDQIVPVDQVGDEYILIEGQGDNTTERPIVVATEANTEVSVNGVSVGTITNKGDYLILSDAYTVADSKNNVNVSYITSDKDIYVYQTLSGNSDKIGPTVGMNFIAPLSTSGIREVSVPYASLLAEQSVTGVVTILTQTGAVLSYYKDDSEEKNSIDLLDPDGPYYIDGVDEWAIYQLSNLEGNYRFYSNKAINIAWLVKSTIIGAAGYYSGFTKEISKITADVEFDSDTDLEFICESYDDNISVSLSEPLPDFYEWYVSDFNDDPISENGPLDIEAPDEETSYFVVGYYRDPDLDQLFNGNFWTKSFTIDSDYEEQTDNLQNPGEFCLVLQSTDANPAFKYPNSFTDMNNDYMFMAISDEKGDVMYQGSSVDVVDGYNYIIKLFGRAVSDKGAYTKSQNLKILVNEDTVVDNFKIDATDSWQSVSALWKPGTAESGVIKIVNNNSGGIHSAFALDSITFVQAVADTAEFVAKVIPSFSYGSDGEYVSFCAGVKDSIDISNGDTSWYDYSWSKDSVDLVDGDVYSGVDSCKLIFLDPQDALEGDYVCTISYKEEYQDCGVGESIDVTLHVTVDDAATVSIDTTNLVTSFCSGSSTSLYASVTGDAGDVEWYINDETSPVSLENPYTFNIDSSGVYTVHCEVENGCGVSADTVVINVLSTPSLNGISSNDDLCVDEDIILVADASGDGTLVYTWLRGSEVLSETGDVLTYTASMDDRYVTFKVKVKSVYEIDGETYTCINNLGLAAFDLDIYPLVEFDEPLVNDTICEGDNHTFSVSMVYPGEYYTYSWEHDGVEFTNNKTSYSLYDVDTDDSGNYRVDVTNRCNSEYSSADLVVTPGIVVNGFSVDQSGPFCLATDVAATFDVDNNGADYVYQVTDPNGLTTTITNPYTFTVNDSNDGDWKFQVSSTCDDPVSFTVSLDMYEDFGDLAVTDIGTCLGENVTFEAVISSIPSESTLEYAWTDPNGDSIGENSDQLDINDVQDEDLGVYTVVVTDQCGNIKTASATLSKEEVTSPTTAAATPICEGDDFTTSVSYLGDPTFVWRFNDPDNGEVVGTTETLSLTNVSVDQAGIYYCTVTLVCGTDVTIQRELIVNSHILVDESTVTVDICQGEKPILSVEVEGDSNDYTIEWKNQGGTVLGTGSPFPLSKYETAGEYTFYAEIVGLCETFNKTVIVNVHEKPIITSVDPIEACEGDIALSISFDTDPDTDYNAINWYNEDGSYLGDGTTYTIADAEYPDAEGTYTAIVTSDYCDDVSTDVEVSIYNPITATTSSLNPTVCEGEDLTMVVTASGEYIEYNWYATSDPSTNLSITNTLPLLSVDASNAQAYTCEVTSSKGCDGELFEFNVSVNELAEITSQPANVDICESESTAEFTITATGDDLTYTWYDSDDNAVGGNSATLSLTGLSIANDGDTYYCIVSTGDCGSVTSTKAILNVIDEVIITLDPESITIADGGNATFSVVASGDPTITYQWQESVNGTGAWTSITTSVGLSGATYSGYTTAKLTIEDALIGDYDGNQYRCVVDNACTPATSDPATLTINVNVKITVQPQDFDACTIGGSGSFTVGVTTTAVVDNYVWEYRENDSDVFEDVTLGGYINGNETLTIPTITEAMSTWEFRCVVDPQTGSNDTTSIVQVNVFTPVTFDPIADVTLCSGSGTLFKVENISGSTPYSYSWERVATSTNLGTNSQLSLSAANASDGTYQVSVGNGVCPDVTDDFEIDHYEDLALDAWINTSETCVGEVPAEELSVTISTIDAALTATYSWTKDADATEIGSGATYTLPGLSSDETGLYNVEVSDGCSTETVSGYVNVYDTIVKNNTWDATKSLCLGTDLSLTVKVSGDNPTYTWTYPGATRTNPGNTSKLKFNSVTLDDAGKYKCTVEGTCGDPVVYTIVLSVWEAPVITTGIDALDEVCVGDALVLGPIVVTGTYDDPIWTLNDNATQVTTDVDYLDLGTAELADAGTYGVSVSNICGDDTSYGTQVVNDTLSLEPIDDQTICEGNDVVFRADASGEELTYEWLVDGDDQNVDSAIFIMDAADVLADDENTSKTYEVVCNITSATGCGSATQSTTLLVEPNTVLNATYKNVVKYVGDTLTMTVDVSGVNLTYLWVHESTDGTKDTLDETSATINIYDLTMDDAGYYNCIIIGSCGQKFASGKLTVKEPVTITSGLDELAEKCVGDPLSLSITASGQISSIQWYKDDVEISGETDLNLYISSLAVTDAGTYSCVIEGEGISQIEEEIIVRVYSLTVLNSTIEDQELCEGEELEWIPDVDGSSDMTYLWILNDTTEVSTDKILQYDSIIISQEGNYEIQITSLCGDVSTNANLEVNALPQFISVSNDTVVCENTSLVEFTAYFTGDDLTYQWMKDGVEISGQTSETLSLSNIDISDDAVYTCQVESDCGSAISTEVSLTVTAQLEVMSDQVDMDVCAGEQVIFTADVVGNDVTYQWKVDGVNITDVAGEITGSNTATLTIDSATLNHSGYYSCTLSDECTSYQSTKPVELVVNALPDAGIYGRMILCAYEDRVTYVTSDQSEISYSWGVDGGIFAGSEEGIKTRITWDAISPAGLSLTIVNTETGCESKVDSVVILNSLPTVELEDLTSKGVCEGEYELTGGYPEGGIYWVNGISQTEFNPSERGAGTYSIYYSYTDENGCSNVTSVDELVVDILPVVSIQDSIKVGSCVATQLTATTTEDNIQWYKKLDESWVDPTDLDDAYSMTPIFTPGETQDLKAVVIDEHSCQGIGIMNIEVDPLPTITTISDTTAGQCNQLELTTDIAGSNDDDDFIISWTHADYLDYSDIRSPKIVDAPEGIFTYEISVTDMYGCDANEEVTVTTVADPVLGDDENICEGDEVYELNMLELENPLWSNSDWGTTETDSVNALDVVTFSDPGDYLLEVSNAYGCGDEQLIVINPVPVLGLNDTLIYVGQSVTLAPNLPSKYGPYYFLWQDGSIEQRYEVTETGTYTLQVEDNIGCTATDSAYVEVKQVGIESANAFLPTSSGDNRKFYLQQYQLDELGVIQDFEMYIYDRWGELLYKTDSVDQDSGWDGMYKGKLCPAGAYVYIVFINGELTNKGTFMLIR